MHCLNTNTFEIVQLKVSRSIHKVDQGDSDETALCPHGTRATFCTHTRIAYHCPCILMRTLDFVDIFAGKICQIR